MIYAYIRISTDKQTKDNQKYEILNFCDEKKIQVNEWVQETAKGTKKINKRKLGSLIEKLNKEDILVVSELSRLGRSLMEVMSILNQLMEKKVKVFAIKEGYELGNNVSSHVLAFAFGLSAQIERDMISQRTKEALARKKAEGKKLGRPKGSLSKETKLTGKDKIIKMYLEKKVPIAVIARLLEVNHVTVKNYITSRKITVTK